MHSHDYKGEDPGFFRDKTVVVLGMGNSAMDIAVEASFTASHTYLAARRGAHILPKYMFGRPIDQMGGLPEDPVRDPAQGRPGDAEGLPRRHGALRAAQARPSLRRRPPDRLRRHPLADGARHDHGEAEHRVADARRRALHRRLGGRGRHRRVLHGLQGHVPVLRRGLHLRARTTTCRCSAAPSTPTSRTCSSSGCCSRSARSCRSPSTSRRGSATTSRAATRCPPPADLRADIERERRAMFKRYVAVQAPHDADRLRRLPRRAGEGAKGGRGARPGATATGCRCRRARALVAA